MYEMYPDVWTVPGPSAADARGCGRGGAPVRSIPSYPSILYADPTPGRTRADAPAGLSKAPAAPGPPTSDARGDGVADLGWSTATARRTPGQVGQTAFSIRPASSERPR